MIAQRGPVLVVINGDGTRRLIQPCDEIAERGLRVVEALNAIEALKEADRIWRVLPDTTPDEVSDTLAALRGMARLAMS